MAALMRHGVLRTGASGPLHARLGAGPPPTRPFATKLQKRKGMDRKLPPTIHSTAQAIAAKGFLRAQKAYQPPVDVETKLENIFNEVAGTADLKAPLADLTQKFNLCAACAREFDHPIPNSLLHAMETLNDVKEFYRTPVDTTTPLDKMRNMELPENLHVQFEYHRFHPETDTMFKGQTAFNRSSTLVTGLKYKDKYKGHIQNTQWPFNS